MSAIESPAWYRALAARCATLAEKATDPQTKVSNLADAERWSRLAEALENVARAD
jgi:hypothetical protein